MYCISSRLIRLLALLGPLATGGCMGAGQESGFLYKNFTIANGSASAGEGHTILFKGKQLPLYGNGIKVGDQLRSVQLTQADLSQISITDTAGKGRVRIISVVPSIDTKVCEQQTHHLSEKNKGLDKLVELITISVDTPFAQDRFAKEAKIDNITFLSDYRNADFGRTYGLLLKDPHFLARAIMVVDPHNTIRYMQITPELAHLPDMDEAFQVARKLVTQG